jgi:hypothetical protein
MKWMAHEIRDEIHKLMSAWVAQEVANKYLEHEIYKVRAWKFESRKNAVSVPAVREGQELVGHGAVARGS